MANMIRFAATGFAAALRFAVLGSFVLAGTLAAVDTAAADDGDSRGPLILREQGNFFVGGAHNANDQIVGQMYVEYWIPQHQEHPFPIILVHGGGQIGAGWSQTPDGRERWVQFFARRGLAVYLVHQAPRARTPHNSHRGPVRDAAHPVRHRSALPPT